jgi:hypothetical protein
MKTRRRGGSHKGKHQPSQTWLRGGTILCVVLALHIAVVMLVLMPAAIEPMQTSNDVASALDVRFIKTRRTPPVAPKKLTLPTRSVMVLERRPHPTVERSPAVATSPASAPLRMTWTPAPSTAPGTYVPGGGMLAGSAKMTQRNNYLPGAADIKGAPHFQMVDPKAQGLAGVIRFIGGLAGAVDRHCVDLDAWQGMTPEERIENHVSEEDMEKIKENYNCKAPRARL